jgi:hypothetical protein
MPGIHAMRPVEGATDAEVVLAYMEPGRAPPLRPGELVVRANLRAPKGAGGPHVIGGQGARLLSWPPALSPLELGWSQLQADLRNLQARPREALEMASTQALAPITAADAQGWFRHGGEALQACENRSSLGAISRGQPRAETVRGSLMQKHLRVPTASQSRRDADRR